MSKNDGYDDVKRFVNKKYEYQTRSMAYPDGVPSTADSDMNQAGWQRIYADVTMDGVYAVYRRARDNKDEI